MTWKQLRLGAFSVVGSAFLLVGFIVRRVGVDRAGTPLMTTFISLGILMALTIAFDVVYHTWRGQGQACRSCGHLRRMKPFRISGPCPNCGEM